MAFMRMMFYRTIAFILMLALCSATQPWTPDGSIGDLDSEALFQNGWKLFLQQTNEYKSWCKFHTQTHPCSDGGVFFENNNCRDAYLDIMILMVTHASNPEQLATLDKTLFNNADFCNRTVPDSAFLTRFGYQPKALPLESWKFYWKNQRFYHDWCEKNNTSTCVTADKKLVEGKRRRGCLELIFPLLLRMNEYNHKAGITHDIDRMPLNIAEFCSPLRHYCPASITTASLVAQAGTATNQSNMSQDAIVTEPSIAPPTTTGSSVTEGTTIVPPSAINKLASATSTTTLSDVALSFSGTTAETTTTETVNSSANISTKAKLLTAVVESSNVTNGVKATSRDNSFATTQGKTNFLMPTLVIASTVLLLLLIFGCVYVRLLLKKSLSTTFND